MKLQVCFKSCGLLWSATFLILWLSACQQRSDLPEDMVAQVNDHYLLKSQLQNSVPDGLDKDVALNLKKQVLTRWVNSEALYQAAQNEGLTLDERERFFVQEYRKALLIEKYLEQKLNRDFKISHREIENYYRDHKDEFIRDKDEVRVVHLFMEQKDKAIFKEIRNSENLLEIIKKYYFDKKSNSERPNGDLGYLPLASLDTRYQRELKRMKTGAISRPIKSEDGYHFFQLLDRQKAGSYRELDLVKDQIILRLKREKREIEKEHVVKQAKEKVQIQTYLSKIEE